MTTTAATPEDKTIVRTQLAALRRLARKTERRETELTESREERNREIVRISKLPGATQAALAEAAGVGETFVRNLIRDA